MTLNESYKPDLQKVEDKLDYTRMLLREWNKQEESRESHRIIKSLKKEVLALRKIINKFKEK